MKEKPETAKPPETPFQRFLRAARHIVNVPKSEVEKAEDQWSQHRQKPKTSN